MVHLDDLLDPCDLQLWLTTPPARAMRVPRSCAPELTPNRRGVVKPTGPQDSAGETACGARAGCFLHYFHCCRCHYVRDLYYVHYSPVSPLRYERRLPGNMSQPRPYVPACRAQRNLKAHMISPTGRRTPVEPGEPCQLFTCMGTWYQEYLGGPIRASVSCKIARMSKS